MKLWTREVADTDFARWMAQQFIEKRPDVKGVRQAAQMMGISHSMLDYYLYKGGFPLGESIEKIAAYFKVPVEEVEQQIPPRSAQRRRVAESAPRYVATARPFDGFGPNELREIARILEERAREMEEEQHRRGDS